MLKKRVQYLGKNCCKESELLNYPLMKHTASTDFFPLKHWFSPTHQQCETAKVHALTNYLALLGSVSGNSVCRHGDRSVLLSALLGSSLWQSTSFLRSEKENAIRWAPLISSNRSAFFERKGDASKERKSTSGWTAPTYASKLWALQTVQQ